ncbi:MAG: hypothetical protein Q4A82_07730 [Corynebacterium sp.]|nr:hypothetical protein [Corynebacterium sp.]
MQDLSPTMMPKKTSNDGKWIKRHKFHGTGCAHQDAWENDDKHGNAQQ